MNGAGGRPRNAAVDTAVLATTIGLLRERGYAGLRINDIAEASGTAKTTIYRRWPTLTHLVVAAMQHALGERAFEATGDTEADLDSLVESGLGFLVDGRSDLLAVALAIHRQGDTELRSTYRQSIIDPIREQAITLIATAIERGELEENTQPDVMVDAVIGGLVYRSAILAEPLSLDQARAFWRSVLSPRRCQSPQPRRPSK